MVTIRPFKIMWNNAVGGVEGSQRSICRRYVLPKLREAYPRTNFQSAWWDDLTYELVKEFTAPPRRKAPVSSATCVVAPTAAKAKVSTFVASAHGTDEGDLKCRCDTRFRCPEHDA